MRIQPWLASSVLALGTPFGAPLGAPPGATLAPVPSSFAPVLRAAQTPAGKLKDIETRYNKQESDVSAAYAKATTDEERGKILAGLPGKEYLPEFRAVAEEAKGTDTAVQAWMWVLRLETDGKQTWEVVQLLLSEHMQSLALLSLPGHLGDNVRRYGEDNVVEALHAMIDESPHEKVRAGALYTLGSTLLASSSEARRAEGQDCLEAVIAEYGKLPSGGSTYEALAKGILFEREHLQIGMSAPDFEAVDENGVSWKLSDYRGKVVVVDFWGFW